MSQTHTHAPGLPHAPTPQPGQPPQPQQQVIVPPPDPLMQAAIEQDFKPVNLKTGPPKDSQALCAEHDLEQCSKCNLDFTALNALAKLFVANPNLACPPPPQVIQQQRSQAVNKTKEDGNVRVLDLTKSNWHSYFVSATSGSIQGAEARSGHLHVYHGCECRLSTFALGTKSTHARRTLNGSQQSFSSSCCCR